MEQSASPPPQKTNTPGGPGSQWRMMRLRRVYETAEEENRLIEEIAIDRFGSLKAFDEAKEERRILDEREGKRTQRGRAQDRNGKGRNEEVRSSVKTMRDPTLFRAMCWITSITGREIKPSKRVRANYQITGGEGAISRAFCGNDKNAS